MDPGDLAAKFEDAQSRVKQLSKTPDNETLLELYALYKQATSGDATGKRPGMMDFKGRAKFDAWSGRKGMAREAAMTAYVALVDKLAGG
jgi:diazepam-binding inhibitor (GABA receptor modulating acyl-CoA-binding protein)